MIPQSPLEKVARAHYETQPWMHATDVPGRAAPLTVAMTWEKIGPVAQQRQIERMATALTALLDPDEGTLAAAAEVGPDTNAGEFDIDSARTVFNAAIQHILKGAEG